MRVNRRRADQRSIVLIVSAVLAIGGLALYQAGLPLTLLRVLDQLNIPRESLQPLGVLLVVYAVGLASEPEKCRQPRAWRAGPAPWGASLTVLGGSDSMIQEPSA